MQRAIDLARLGAGRVSPNPMVGAVVVHNDQIVGEGWHQSFGGPHAEVHAIANVVDSKVLPEATVYVSLEPCSHHGKTPPCADLLVEKKVKRVVVGIKDPNPKVAGRGIAKLEEAGIEVVHEVLRDECYKLNRPFFINQRRKRPYIFLKWAQTSDGFIARDDFSSKWISGKESRTLVHKWRAESDGILVGKNTARYDNPTLTVRDWTGEDPLRIVLDRNNELPRDLELFQGAPQTVCFTAAHSVEEENTTWVAIGEDMQWQKVLEYLYTRGIGTLMVEGGAKVLSSLIEAGLWDDARIFVGDTTFGSGVEAPILPIAFLRETLPLPDTLHLYSNPNSDG